MKQLAGLVLLTISTNSNAYAGDLDKFKPLPPQPKSDLQRAIENPPAPHPPPTALQKIERGEIPSSKNPMPPPREGVSPTMNPPGIEYRKTY